MPAPFSTARGAAVSITCSQLSSTISRRLSCDELKPATGSSMATETPSAAASAIGTSWGPRAARGRFVRVALASVSGHGERERSCPCRLAPRTLTKRCRGNAGCQRSDELRCPIIRVRRSRLCIGRAAAAWDSLSTTGFEGRKPGRRSNSPPRTLAMGRRPSLPVAERP
jgi:hypothetical protein